KYTVFAQPVDKLLGSLHALVGRLHHLISLGVNSIDQPRCVALRTDLLHFRPRLREIRALVSDGIGQVIRQPLRRIVGNTDTVDAAHMACGARWHKHVASGEGFRRRIQVQQTLLRLEHDPVLRLLIDLYLRVIRPHVALRTGARKPGNAHGSRVSCVTRGATANRAVGVGPSNAVALFASAGHGRTTLELDKRVRRPARASRLIRLRKLYLFRTQSLLAVDRSPRRPSMAATQKLLVDILVTAAAVAGRQFGRDDEPVMFLFLLSGRWLMTVEAIHTFLSMQAHLVFVHYGILNSRVAFCALALPLARTNSGLGCSVSTFGLARLTKKAPTMSAKAMTT